MGKSKNFEIKFLKKRELKFGPLVTVLKEFMKKECLVAMAFIIIRMVTVTKVSGGYFGGNC
jgi:hypothetical protein